jgi:hypothetical protein
MGWTINVPFPKRAGIFPFTTASRLALGLIQPPIQWILGLQDTTFRELALLPSLGENPILVGRVLF